MRPALPPAIRALARRGATTNLPVFSTGVERCCGIRMAVASPEHEARDAWAHVLDRAREELPETTVVMWFADVRPIGLGRRFDRARGSQPARARTIAAPSPRADRARSEEAVGRPREGRALRRRGAARPARARRPRAVETARPRSAVAASYAAIGAPADPRRPASRRSALRACRSRATPSTRSCPDPATGSRTPRRWPWPRRRPRPRTTRCSSTGEWGWARRTC